MCAIPHSAANGHLTFDVEYRHPAVSVQNPVFTGSGRLSIDASGPVYIFTGQPRSNSTGASNTVSFRATEIINVVVQGRAVQFTPRPADAGSKTSNPFVFFANDDTSAREIAQLLPTERDQEFDQQLDFQHRLHTVAPPRPAWTQVTNVLIALNIAAFIVMAGVFGAGWFEVKDMTPYVLYGANNGAATTDGEWWRLVTSMFLHYGILHLALNMWALFSAGQLLERLLGRVLFTLMYFGAGLAGGFASIVWHADRTWSAGASGAVFGVFGGLLGFMLRQKHSVPPVVFKGLTRSALSFAGYNIFFGLVHPGIDNAAHLGGFAGGFVLSWLVALPIDLEVRRRLWRGRVALGIAALAALGFAGVSLTPRFDYRIRDEIALGDISRDIADREEALLRQHHGALDQLDSPAARAAHARWMQAELVPFYRDWRDQLAALDLAPGRATARRRDLLLKFVDLRLHSYEQLISDLQTNVDDAIPRFIRRNQDAVKVLEELRRETDR